MAVPQILLMHLNVSLATAVPVTFTVPLSSAGQWSNCSVHDLATVCFDGTRIGLLRQFVKTACRLASRVTATSKSTSLGFVRYRLKQTGPVKPDGRVRLLFSGA